MKNRANVRTQAYLSTAYVARMCLVTEGVVKRYEDGSLLGSNPRGASAKNLQERLDRFYSWLEGMPRDEPTNAFAKV